MGKQRICKNLMQLHPGEDVQHLYRKYMRGKWRTGMLVVLAGGAFALLGGESGPLLAGLGVVTSVLIFFLSDKDLEQRNQERKLEMRKEYPGIVNRMALYMEAGMTIRGAFCRIEGEYARGKKSKNPIAVELAIAGNSLRSGVSEAVVYESFGRRTGMQEYTRFCAILNQSLKKGSVEITLRLRQEGERAQEEGMRFQKKRGEEAETKLLLPMMISMAMVMILIMVPAFSGMDI